MNHCIYHNADLDGKCSGAVVRRYFDGDVNMLGMNYGDKFDTTSIAEGDTVIMSDFSLPMEQMRKLTKKCNFIWCDHHRTSILDAQDQEIFPDGLRDEGLAGCELTWKYLFPSEPMPLAVVLLGKYDTWRWKDESPTVQQDILAFQSAMRLSAMWPDDGDWSLLFDHESYVYDKVQVGESILEYQQQMMNIMYNKFWVAEWEGYTWLVANCQQTSSAYYEAHPEYNNVDGILIWCQVAPNRYITSLRHAGRKSDLVCGAVAKKYGGGGHPGAAGFKSANPVG